MCDMEKTKKLTKNYLYCIFFNISLINLESKQQYMRYTRMHVYKKQSIPECPQVLEAYLMALMTLFHTLFCLPIYWSPLFHWYCKCVQIHGISQQNQLSLRTITCQNGQCSRHLFVRFWGDGGKGMNEKVKKKKGKRTFLWEKTELCGWNLLFVAKYSNPDGRGCQTTLQKGTCTQARVCAVMHTMLPQHRYTYTHMLTHLVQPILPDS